MAELEHPGDELLASMLDGDLASDHLERLLDHLDRCEHCSQRLDELEPALARYRRCRELIGPRVFRPAREWPDLSSVLERLDRQVAAAAIRPKPRLRRPVWVGAIAAGVLVAGLLLWPRPGNVARAEVLLERARASAALRPAVAGRLHVRTRSASFVRPVILDTAGTGGDAGRVASRFVAAHYDWRDPVSADSYSAWRRRLARKTDDVVETTADYTIRTTTPEGALREASLQLQAKDLAPVGGRFVFADEDWVEISVLPETHDAAESQLPAQAPPQAPADAGHPMPPLGERELHVRIAIDQLFAEAGAPIEVEPAAGDRILVTPYGLAPDQDRQLRERLETIEGVTVQPGNPIPGALAAAAPSESAIDLADAIAARAHLLEKLAERFPPGVEAQLPPADQKALLEMRRRHAAEVNRETETLWRRVSETRALPPAAADTAGPPVSEAALVKAAAHVDRLVTTLAPTFGQQAAPVRMWQQLADELASLRRLSSEYAALLHQAQGESR